MLQFKNIVKMRLEQLLSTKGLVQQAPSADEIRERARLVSPQSIKLFYGETYDEKGDTLDSMKYYFFVAELSDALREEGFAVDPMILVADVAACRNVKNELQNKYMLLGANRARFVEQINLTYGTNLRVVRMSEYIDSTEFVQDREEIMQICKANLKLMEGVEKTVPESKLDVEQRKGFLYSFDEITTIIDLDVKVGPPREDLYDNIARQIAEERGAKGVQSLFLTPTFPLGMNWAYFFANDGIEDHGITAYKAGSKQLHRQRVIVGKSNPDYIKRLLMDSFISTDSRLPNPVLDVGIISEMARRRLEGDSSPITLADDFYGGKITPDQLKEDVGRSVEKYVLSKF